MYLQRLLGIAGLAMTFWNTSTAALSAKSNSAIVTFEKRQSMTLEGHVTDPKSQHGLHRRSEDTIPDRVTQLIGYRYGKFVGECVCQKVQNVRIVHGRKILTGEYSALILDTVLQ